MSQPRKGQVIYDVFGRAKPGAPITHLGALEAPSEEFACLYASQIFARRGEHHDLHVEARADQKAAPTYERVLEHHALRYANGYSRRATQDEGKQGDEQP